MSTSLAYEPLVNKPKLLCDRLKNIFKNKYLLEDSEVILDEYDLSYLKGLADAGVPDVDVLIELIEEKKLKVKIYLY